MLPEDAIEALKAQDCFLIGTATTLSEAQLLVKSGVDAIVAQGMEAGGHRGVFDPSHDEQIPLPTLLSQLIDNISLPIIAAGGIAESKEVQSALDLGAAAVQVGTAFLTTKESSTNGLHKKALLAQTSDCTEITSVFTGRPARAIQNTFVERMKGFESKVLPFPIQRYLTDPIRKRALEEGREDMCNLWAGQKAHLCKPLSAEELIQLLWDKELTKVN